MQEGELCFGNEPLLRVEAPLIQAQLIETVLLNIINFHTLISTKASRIRQVAPDDTLMEFGTRRAQELDAALWGLELLISVVLILLVMCVPVNYLVYPFLVRMHALVQTYGDEYKAFKIYAERHKIVCS